MEHLAKHGRDKAVKQREKQQKRIKVERKKEFFDNDMRHQKKLAQHAINKFVKLRDKGAPCISCQRHHQGQIHAGHFRSVGSAPQLRFNEDNIHLQCAPCNTHLSGNLIAYRLNLIGKIGVVRVEALENNNKVKKYTIEEVIAVKNKYSELCKQLTADA